MCFRCLIFSLSGPCELLYCLVHLSCGESNVISLYELCWSVHAYICFVCCVSDSVGELFVIQFAICLGVVVILLLNVMVLFCVGSSVLFQSIVMLYVNCRDDNNNNCLKSNIQ